MSDLARLKAEGLIAIEKLEEDVALLIELRRNGAAPPPVENGPVFVDLRKIEERDIEWIDEPFLPCGELVTNNADGDTGKGLLSVHWAARISRGEFGESRRMVVFAVAEDAFDTVLKPRLLAARANLAHVRALTWRRDGTMTRS